MTEVRRYGNINKVTIKPWNAKVFSKQGDSGALTFAVHGGHIYAVGIHQLGFTASAQGSREVAISTSLTSAIEFAGTRAVVVKEYSLAFDQSKTCVLSSKLIDAL